MVKLSSVRCAALFSILISAVGCMTGAMARSESEVTAPACDAASAVELDVKRYKSGLFQDEFWGKCVKFEGAYIGHAGPYFADRSQRTIQFYGYQGSMEATGMISFLSPKSQGELLFAHKQGDRMTVFGRVEGKGGVLGGFGEGMIVTDRITFP